MNVDTGSFRALTDEVEALRAEVAGLESGRSDLLQKVFKYGIEAGIAIVREDQQPQQRRDHLSVVR